MNPFSDANAPRGSFKAKDDYKKMSYEDLINEHKKLGTFLRRLPIPTEFQDSGG